MAVATYEDVAVAIGRPISEQAEQNQVEYWLAGVELFIRARYGDLAGLDAETVLYVETEAVAAKVRRSSQASSVSVAVDDGTITHRYENVSARDISDELWDLLEPRSSADAFSISPYATRQQPIRGDRWCW